MFDFWRDAVDMAGGSDPDIIVEVVEKLAGDIMGPQCIEQVLCNDYPGPAAPNSCQDDYMMDSICFIWFMAHREIVSNFSIEKNVGILYSYLHRSEAANFFAAIAGQLSDEVNTSNRRSKLWATKILGRRFSFSHALARVLECLRHTLRHSRTTGSPKSFETVIERLSILAIPIPVHDKFYRSINDSLGEILCIQWHAKSIELQSVKAVKPESTKYAPPTSPDDIDYPGHLSPLGARHDNDFTVIHQIKPFPTAGEIMSERPDYLPYKAKSEPHFLTALDRLMDTQFRLIRNDYIGEVKEAINKAFNILSLAKKGREEDFYIELKPCGFFYREVSVVSAEFDIHGLQMRLSLGKLSPGWKAESKQLETGSLACLLSFDNGLRQATSVTISRGASDKYQQGGKYCEVFIQVIDPEDYSGLSFLFQQVSGPSKPRTLALVGFPGIFPSRFLPLLRNLQELSYRGTHPLSRWIVPGPGSILAPDSDDTHGDTVCSADAPSEKESYWDLKPILKSPTEDAPLSNITSLRTREEIEKLEQVTILDLEQCRALVAGLSPGMTLIQGPPATGKGFVGLQLVRVLVQNKPQRPVGPIICL